MSAYSDYVEDSDAPAASQPAGMSYVGCATEMSGVAGRPPAGLAQFDGERHASAHLRSRATSRQHPHTYHLARSPSAADPYLADDAYGGDGGSGAYGQAPQARGVPYMDPLEEAMPLCDCGQRCTRLTSNTARNPGRIFYRCGKGGRDVPGACRYFKWADELKEEGAAGGQPQASAPFASQVRRPRVRGPRRACLRACPTRGRLGSTSRPA